MSTLQPVVRLAIRDLLLSFQWDSYGLAVLSDPDTSTEWADALAVHLQENL